MRHRAESSVNADSAGSADNPGSADDADNTEKRQRKQAVDFNVKVARGILVPRASKSFHSSQVAHP
jgi:hypothetical protein